jgi:hypothetical protein
MGYAVATRNVVAMGAGWSRTGWRRMVARRETPEQRDRGLRGNNADLLRECDGGCCFSGGFVIFD